MLLYSKVLLMVMVTSTFGFQFDSKVFTKMEKKKEVENLKHILRNIESSALKETTHIDKIPNKGCVCVNDNCGCCAHIDLNPLHIHETICANVSYLPAEIGIGLTVTFGKLTIINQTVSVRNPPSICVDIPDLKQVASVCIKFHDLDLNKSELKGCIAIGIRLIKVIHENYELGCFTIPLQKEIGSAALKTPEGVFNMTGREPSVRLLSSKDGKAAKH